MTVTNVLLLTIAAFFAGLVDSMAGGGGLISLPALLVAGVPPHVALGTNKVQSCVGTAFGAGRYWRGGHPEPRIGSFAAVGAFVGSILGASLALVVAEGVFLKAVPFLIAIVGAVTFLKPSFGLVDRFTRTGRGQILGAAGLGFSLGLYDGLFGPGTGTFLVFSFVFLFGFEFLRATANAKLANLASNLGALVIFAPTGKVFWPAALPMAAANIAGNWLGAGLAMRKGSAVIKPLFGLVLAGLLVKLLFFT